VPSNGYFYDKLIGMAQANEQVIGALRQAADQLRQSNRYQWGHMGSCNCGFVAQHVTHLTPAEIHRRAMLRHGDWTEQLNDYCPTSGLPFDDVISEMLAAGFERSDLRHLERLSDPRILQHLPEGKRQLTHNKREDVILYLSTWASILEEEFTGTVSLPNFTRELEAV
jgi:hypothetical protein